MVIEVLCELTKIYDIRFHVVLAYSPSMKDFSYLEHTVMPEGIENVPPRLAIIYRNKYMLSLVKSEHISVQRIDELLSDCSPFELKAIYEMLKTIKTVLRKYGERLTIIVYFCLTDSIDGDAQLYTETHNLLLCT